MAGVDISLTLSSSTRSTSALLTEAQKNNQHESHTLFMSFFLRSVLQSCCTSTTLPARRPRARTPVPSERHCRTHTRVQVRVQVRSKLASRTSLWHKPPTPAATNRTHESQKREGKAVCLDTTTNPTRIDTAARWTERGKQRKRKKRRRRPQRRSEVACMLLPNKTRKIRTSGCENLWSSVIVH